MKQDKDKFNSSTKCRTNIQVMKLEWNVNWLTNFLTGTRTERTDFYGGTWNCKMRRNWLMELDISTREWLSWNRQNYILESWMENQQKFLWIGMTNGTLTQNTLEWPHKYNHDIQYSYKWHWKTPPSISLGYRLLYTVTPAWIFLRLVIPSVVSLNFLRGFSGSNHGVNALMGQRDPGFDDQSQDDDENDGQNDAKAAATGQAAGLLNPLSEPNATGSSRFQTFPPGWQSLGSRHVEAGKFLTLF